MTKFPTFAINLERDKERYKNIVSQLEAHKDITDFTIIRAIDAIEEAKRMHDILLNTQDKMRYIHNRPCTISEIACFLSHQKALKAFLDTGEESGLIIEDDAIISDKLWSNLPDIMKYSNKNSNLFINLYLHPTRKIKYFRYNNKLPVIHVLTTLYSGVCYVVTRNIAKILLSYDPICQYDYLTRMIVKHGISHATVPYRGVEVMDTESSIDFENTKNQKTYIFNRKNKHNRFHSLYGCIRNAILRSLSRYFPLAQNHIRCHGLLKFFQTILSKKTFPSNIQAN